MYDSLKKPELINRVAEFVKAGVIWDVPEAKPEDLNRNELIAWLTANENKIPGSVPVPAAEIAAPEALPEVPPASASIEPPHSPEAVKKANRRAYYHGVLIKTLQDNLIGHRIYKDIILENGVGYKLTREEFDRDVTYEGDG